MRRILQIDGAETSVAAESRFEDEQYLHDAIAARPEVLPSEDLRLGPLIALARELDLGFGPMDLLTADPAGRIVIVEFKRGSENPDVRKVVAQLLDYGASLWRTSFDDLDQRCQEREPAQGAALEELAAERCETLGVDFDPGKFRAGVEDSLDRGDFVFLYVGRDLDERSRRIMTFLAEGPQMTFFAVEVDYFPQADLSSAVLVPRTAFVPSWISEPTPRRGRPGDALATAPPEFHELVERMDALMADLHLMKVNSPQGFNYQPRHTPDGARWRNGILVAVGRVEVYIGIFRDFGRDDIADRFQKVMSDLTGDPMTPSAPSVALDVVAAHWPRFREELVEPYFDERDKLANAESDLDPNS